MIGKLFNERLRQHKEYNIIFSKRGKSKRLDTLMKLVETASGSSSQRQDIKDNAVLNVSAATPKEYAGLQAVDYFVWALQRLYERDEERYLSYLWEAFRTVHDIDDTREDRNGIYYTQSNRLRAETLQWRK